MANLIQIKRSLNTANPTTLANGEFAYTANGNVLFIGSNSSVVAIAGARNPGTLTANQALVANSTSGIDKVIVANAVVTALTANGSQGTSGQLLTSNGTVVYWSTPAASVTGSNTQVQFNDSGTLNATAGFTFNKSTNNITIANTLNVGSVVATGAVNAASFSGNGASVTSVDASTVGGNTAADLRTYADNKAGNAYSNAIAYAASNSTVYSTFAQNTAVYSTFAQNTSVYSTFAQNTSVYSTFAQNTAVYTNFAQLAANNSFTGNNTLGGTTTTVSSNLNVSGFVSNSFIPSANITYNIGNNTLRFNEGHFKNVHSVDGYFDGSVSISGNLIVSGNVTTTNVSSVIISDPLIYLAGNNYASDLVDIGFAGNYNIGAVNAHTGLFRHASDDTYYLFKGLTQELSGVSVVNVADPTFAIADLKAYLISGGLISNAATVAITANSTVNVNITANTLTLSTALAATSGGSGQSSYTAGDILTASNSSYLSKLSLGTSGYVLQSNGTALVYGTLDGGSF